MEGIRFPVVPIAANATKYRMNRGSKTIVEPPIIKQQGRVPKGDFLILMDISAVTQLFFLGIASRKFATTVRVAKRMNAERKGLKDAKVPNTDITPTTTPDKIFPLHPVMKVLMITDV